MRFNSLINLIPVTYPEDEIGNRVETQGKPRQTFAAKKSVTRSEFYQAASSVFKPEITFIVWTLEYQDEPILEYGGKTYKVTRTFDRDDQKTELVCELKTNG